MLCHAPELVNAAIEQLDANPEMQLSFLQGLFLYK
jgi:hypothetical protein